MRSALSLITICFKYINSDDIILDLRDKYNKFKKIYDAEFTIDYNHFNISSLLVIKISNCRVYETKKSWIFMIDNFKNHEFNILKSHFVFYFDDIEYRVDAIETKINSKIDNSTYVHWFELTFDYGKLCFGYGDYHCSFKGGIIDLRVVVDKN